MSTQSLYSYHLLFVFFIQTVSLILPTLYIILNFLHIFIDLGYKVEIQKQNFHRNKQWKVDGIHGVISALSRRGSGETHGFLSLLLLLLNGGRECVELGKNAIEFWTQAF